LFALALLDVSVSQGGAPQICSLHRIVLSEIDRLSDCEEGLIFVSVPTGGAADGSSSLVAPPDREPCAQQDPISDIFDLGGVSERG
jgi:hypothetical protein